MKAEDKECGGMTSTIAMMQPYLFPYLNYFQLIAASDVFVLGDDLQYIKSGWINRNRVLDHNEARMITFPLKRDSFDLGINQRQLSDTFDDESKRLINVLKHHYSRAPCFPQVMPLLERLIGFPERNLALYIEHAIRGVCTYLHIDTRVVRASDLKLPRILDKQDRVIQTAKLFDATLYLNPMGGMTLYDQDYFSRQGLALKFMQMDEISYLQYRLPFVSNLSIIDVMMFNDVQRIQALLGCYSLHLGGITPVPVSTSHTASS
jgi:hypothetical protein